MKKRIAFCVFFLALAFPSTARPDFFGGDVLILSQILVQTIQQLAQMRQILSTGQDSLGLIQDINRGINDSLVLMQTISPNRDPGIYANWQKVDQALNGVQSIYGIAAPSKDARVQQDADQSAAEAVALNNSIYEYTEQIDDVGERIKSDSHSTSPGGAQKLTAESLGVMLNVMNESLRAQATGLKLQAQTLAIENKKDKDMSRQMLSDSDGLKSAMQSDPADFSVPRF
jgi:hypothetical protein